MAGAALFAIALAGCTQLLGAPEPAPIEDRAIQGPSGAIFVDDGGMGGVPVVFLHSFGGDSTHWASQLDHLRHHRRALALDLRGHGKSAKPKDLDYSVAANVRDLEAVVKELKLPKFVLVGHSLGASIANAYAAAHPEKVAGVVLVGAPGKMPAEESRKVIAALESDYSSTMKQYMDRLLADAQPHVKSEVEKQLAAMPRDESLAIIRATFADDPLPAFDKYRGPRLLVYSSQPDGKGGLQAARPDVRQKAFEGTSHWPHLDKPREFDATLDGFLAQIG